jgi:hypothetical protein
MPQSDLTMQNLERLRKDLEELIQQGHELDLAMAYEIDPKGFSKQVTEHWGKDKIEAFVKKLPNFKSTYEAWYSESIVVLRQLLPDRVDNFIALYEKPKVRKEVTYGTYVIQDYMQGLRITRYGGTEVVVDSSAALPQFRQQLAILNAASRRFESSLFEVKQLMQADLFDSEIEAARELLKASFLRAAGAVAGVVLEKHLRQVCDDRKLKITKKHAAISDLNELLKTNSVIEIPQWRQISFLGDIRNLCTHNKENEPTLEQVRDLIDGTTKVMKTIA